MTKTSGLLWATAVILLAAISPAALADTYYVATHYESDTDGQSALAVNGDSVRGTENGHKIAEIASVNAGGMVASSFITEIDCDAHTWRVNKESDFDLQQNMAPTVFSPRELPALSQVAAGTPSRAAMDFVCAWPGNKTAAAKVTANDTMGLSKALAKTLTFDVKPTPGD